MFADSIIDSHASTMPVSPLVDNAPKTTNVKDDVLVRHLAEHLNHHPHFRGRSNCLAIRSRFGVVRIDGCLPSWYLKQVLQTTVSQMPGVKRFCNRVHVRDWDHVCNSDKCSAQEKSGTADPASKPHFKRPR
jgi:hypothetical protein